MKQHKGRFTNKIEYTGWIRKIGGDAGQTGGKSPHSRTKWRIEGAYGKGRIALSKVREFRSTATSVAFDGAASRSRSSDTHASKHNDGDSDGDSSVSAAVGAKLPRLLRVPAITGNAMSCFWEVCWLLAGVSGSKSSRHLPVSAERYHRRDA